MSQSKIQISNEIVRDGSIKATEFAMVLQLKKYHFLSGKKDVLSLDPKKLMFNLGISDNRTFKKILDSLWQNGFILEQIEKLPRGKPLELKLNQEKLDCKSGGFTQLPTDLLCRVDEVGFIGIRLLYFYESYINRNNKSVKYCFTSYETIKGLLGYSTTTIAEYNEKLIKAKLLKVTKHKLETDYDFDENDALVFDKWNNHYEPRIDKMYRGEKK